MATKKLNRIKVMLAERNQTNKWLAEQVGKDPATVSKWVTNASQPSLEMIFKIAEVLKCNYTDLIRDVEEQHPIINDSDDESTSKV
jgi:transcriptional regulator with XRE-family HTH domain